MNEKERWLYTMTRLSIGWDIEIPSDQMAEVRAEFGDDLVEENGRFRLRPERAWQLRGELLQPPTRQTAGPLRVRVRKHFNAAEAEPYQAEVRLVPEAGWQADPAGTGGTRYFLAKVAAPAADECDERIERALELVAQGAMTRLANPANWPGAEEHFVVTLTAPAIVRV